MWVSVKERQPVKAGEYKVMRRGIGNRPNYEDICKWNEPVHIRDFEIQGYWTNRVGKVIGSVESWEEADHAEA